jgi:hypothetical protein
MSLKRIFWAMLAGVSFSLAGCEEENPPLDASESSDAADTEDTASTEDVRDTDADESGAQEIYGVADMINRDVFDVFPDEPGVDDPEPPRTV